MKAGVRRVFLIVLDSFGIGALPDASAFGDAGADTLGSCARTGKLRIPHLLSLGLGNIEGVQAVAPCASPCGAYGRAAERSAGKDTTVGHWELAGLISAAPLPTFPQGFPPEVIDAFARATGRGVLCNRPYSGTEVIRDYGDAHMQSGDLIVYTSADSVFQIAAHEECVPPEQLYEYCRMARRILTGKYGVGRVIARPFTGRSGEYTRTANRRDFSLEPPAPTLLDALHGEGLATLAVGKIGDIFAGRGISERLPTHGNAEGLAVTLDLLQRDFHGLTFVNLVDFDSLYGHRRDADGYAAALCAFDNFLGRALPMLGTEDLLLVTADHGCDPGYAAGTDHTREYIPILCAGRCVRPVAIGTRSCFADVGATVAEVLGSTYRGAGKSFAKEILP